MSSPEVITTHERGVIQIVFNDISAAELSRLPSKVQFQLLEALNIQPADARDDILSARYGVLERSGKRFYRSRAGDYRIYFGLDGGHVRVHRVLHANTLQDFLFRSNLPGGGEDQALSQSKHFWHLIDEGAKTLKLA
ncbi:MAG: hypothetical protein IPK32_07095 [Verrucomicrobiaceae bacterium]|nr:hypothetical protein [Verrucomicrobiaceae bacterium]